MQRIFMLKLQNLSKSFNSNEALHDLSVTVSPGEILGLLGANGAGKTTTLRLASGVIAPDKGTILINGHNIETHPIEAKRTLAYLADQPAFFRNLTCWEHIQVTAKIFELSNWKSKAEELLVKFEIIDKRDALPSELSKGMRQKLGLVNAFIHQPQLYLFDEPMTGLDPNAINNLNHLIVEVSKAGAAVVLSSHLLSYLEQVCTKTLVLKKGKRVLYGTIAELKAKYPEIGSDASLEEIFIHITKEKTEL